LKNLSLSLTTVSTTKIISKTNSIQAFLECLLGNAEDNHLVVDGSSSSYVDRKLPLGQSTEEISSSFLSTLFAAEKSGHDLECRLQDIVRSCGWRDGLAERILNGVEAAVKAGAAMGGAMKVALNKATAAATDFRREHPFLFAEVAIIIAIGILVILAPWVIEVLGFGELGPIEGKSSVSEQSIPLILHSFVGSKVAIDIS
jgi:hypothetical protein